MNHEKLYEHSVSALAELEKLHSQFVKDVSDLVEKEFLGGAIAVQDGELVANCLGVKLQSIRRFVVREGLLSAIEYAFHTEINGQRVVVWSAYLEPHYSLYGDPSQQVSICSANNKYLAQRLMPFLAAALLNSPVFAHAS